jgi:hypothetical protein
MSDPGRQGARPTGIQPDPRETRKSYPMSEPTASAWEWHVTHKGAASAVRRGCRMLMCRSSGKSRSIVIFSNGRCSRRTVHIDEVSRTWAAKRGALRGGLQTGSVRHNVHG